MGTVKAENYPDNGKCVSGYCTKINDKQNITLLHGRIQDIGGGGNVLTSSLSVGDKWPKILSNVDGKIMNPLTMHIISKILLK